MRWSKIKNIIILLLVVVNGFLLAQVGLREWRSHRNERETRERMIAILARNDVSYLPGSVPGGLELTSRRVTLSPFGQDQAALLVGAVADVQDQGTQTLYTGAEGTAVLTAAGELTVEFPEGNTLTESVLLERLSKLGVSLRSLTLRLLAGTEEVLPQEETITAVTALARLLDELSRGEGYVCSQITDLYPGYVSGGTGPVTLTPAWFIETDVWPRQFAVDGLTGAVTAAE